MSAKGKVEALDAYQQQHRGAGAAVATAKKFQEDNATNLASMIAFWAFFSIFPLLLAFITLLGYFVPDHLKHQVLGNVAKMFPLLNTSDLGALSGSWWPLIVGFVSALWSGSAVVRTTQFAFNSVWEIPRTERPKLAEKVLRSVLTLGTLGVLFVISTLVSGYVSGGAAGLHLGFVSYVIGYAISLALDVVLFVAAFRMLTDRDVSTRTVLPGALLSGIAFFILEIAASLIISRYLHNAKSTYGNFATVITILWWFYLQAIITLLGAELNVVLHESLHPRALAGPPATPADERAYRSYAKERTYHDNEQVDASFDADEPATQPHSEPDPRR